MRFLFVAIIATVSVLMSEARYDRYREERTRGLPQRDRGHHGPHERGHHGSHERDHHGRHHDSHDRQHHRDHDHHRPDPRREHPSSWRDLGRASRDRFDRYGYYNYERAMRPSYGFLDSLRNRYESTHRRGRHNSRSSSSSSSSSSEEERYDRRKCNKQTEQPSYTVQCVSPDGYEVREYEEAMWVTTVVNTTSYEEGGRIGFRRLFSYISGDNSQNVRIKMTKPVRKRIIREEDGESGYQNNLYSVSFFVPPKFFNNTPEPLNNEIFIELESSYVYAFNFSGWAYESRITEMYNNLSDFLEETDQPMVASEFSVQGFDSPRSTSGRHNEILIPVDSDFGEPTCGPTTTEQPTMLPPNGITQCLRNECPTYTERSSLSDRIVIREVSAGVYATKRSTTCNMSAVMDETYTPLRNYFLGSNSERLIIPTTVPILQLGVRPERVSASCNFTYQTSFYIPERYQKAPPTPDDETVFISSADAMSYYVLTFEESPTPNIAFSKYTELATFLRESDLCFFPGNFQLAFYDAPWRPLPHRYEVWIPLAETCGNDVMHGSIEILFPQTEDENLIMPALNGDPTV